MKFFIFLSCVFLYACSGMEQSQKQSIRKQNCKAEYILRKAKDKEYVFETPKIRPKPVYAFQENSVEKKPLKKNLRKSKNEKNFKEK